MALGRLHVLTDYHFQQRFSHAALAHMTIDGGADVIQFRQKHGGIRHRLREARKAAEVCASAGCPLIVNDALDLALAVDATGVHLGQEDLPISTARELLGQDRIIGATATTSDQAIRAWKDGATYVGFGPVYTTGSKSNPAATKGLSGLRTASEAVSIPIIAIAGITAERVPEVIAAGAYGVAVMTAVTTAEDPTEATAAIRRALDEAIRGT